MTTRLQLISQSEVRCFRRCQREHHYRYTQLARPIAVPGPLAFGRVIDDALKAYSESNAMPLEAGLQACEGAADPYERAKAEAMIMAYHARWEADASHTVIATAVRFDAGIYNPGTRQPSRKHRLAGELDGVVLDTSDRLLILERKTTSEDISPGSDYWARLTIDAQISAYYVGARARGYDVEGCLYDVLRKPGLQPLRATPVESRKYTARGLLYAAQRDRDETPDEYRARIVEEYCAHPDKYFSRGIVVRLADEERDAAEDLWSTVQQMRASALLPRPPRNPDACRSWGRSCDYLPVCAGRTSIDDTTIYRRAPVAHEELVTHGNAAE